MKSEYFKVAFPTDIVVENGGLFSSRGRGHHPARALKSYELILVRRGLLKLREEDRRFNLLRGDALVLFPGRLHRGVGHFSRGLQFYWVHFLMTEPLEATGSDNALAVPQHATIQDPSRMEDLFRQFLHDQESGVLRPQTAASYVRLMLAQMVPAGKVCRSETRIDQHASRVNEYIKTHFHEPIQPAEIAARFKLNVDYIGRLYKQAYGMTMTGGIRRARVKKAREYLLHSDANINEIARDCGFASSAYFRRCFEREEGLAPTVWRKRHATYHPNTT